MSDKGPTVPIKFADGTTAECVILSDDEVEIAGLTPARPGMREDLFLVDLDGERMQIVEVSIEIGDGPAITRLRLRHPEHAPLPKPTPSGVKGFRAEMPAELLQAIANGKTGFEARDPRSPASIAQFQQVVYALEHLEKRGLIAHGVADMIAKAPPGRVSRITGIEITETGCKWLADNPLRGDR